MLGVERVEVLLEPLIGRDPGIDRAAESLCERPVESQGLFRGFVSDPEIRVSRKPETWFAR